MTPNERPIIIVKKVKKVAGGHHGGAWKVAYADFVTAMMAFFMLLWLLGTPEKAKLEALADYFSPAPPSMDTAAGMGAMSGQAGHARSAQGSSRTSAGVPTPEAGTAGAARGGTAAVPDAAMRVLATELQVALDTVPSDSAGKKNTEVEQSRDGLRITLMDSDRQSMFRAGTDALNPFAVALLARVAEKLSQAGGQIAIEGHTDGAGGNSSANWKLSGDRAIAARDSLLASGLPADRISEIVALANSRPVYPEQPDRPENRRITIVLKGEASPMPSDTSFRF